MPTRRKLKAMYQACKACVNVPIGSFASGSGSMRLSGMRALGLRWYRLLYLSLQGSQKPWPVFPHKGHSIGAISGQFSFPGR